MNDRDECYIALYAAKTEPFILSFAQIGSQFESIDIHYR